MTLRAGIPSPPIEWASFTLGPLTLHWYAIIILIGIVAATLWTNHRLTKRGGEPWVVMDIALWAVLLGLLGARLYHVFTHPADYFYEGANPLAIFFIWEGGNAIIGALIGGAVGIFIASRYTGIRFWSFADALAPGLLLAQAIGRLGNYVNNELFGQPTDLPWGLQIDASNPAFPVGLPEGTLFHPTFLYELLWNLAGVALILLAERMFRLRWGKAIALYLVWYGIGRIWIESLRVDYSEIILGMRSNVFGALCLVIIGIVIYIVQARRHPEPEPGVYLPGRGPADLDAAAARQDEPETRDEPDAGADDDGTATTEVDSEHPSETSR
ncbi:prolipoprotein diacylglyceryl transferase [Pseudoclavibacter endophyticus]|uniref:Phosphatidylglycerol--prolipoprotein diacylglyceryl transferase n=1 Tax=Pseudoclavibacter endophyticus TaxID=1778590 RepID=A0A6H9WGN0_9MICO|nr:prolipoprotein diacylglyceryl transferase [Pseudoclavibacter endophyticus]KAB1650109.1 prolipoprotein diacylglyceryl transferase [Pseudoclavibacter endophyticus]GGA57166.1 prolipoprotein diacylglyceryl transferase [Pseudoclavibacter endophyticus]